MLAQIKTALLGDAPRSNGGWIFPSGTGPDGDETREESTVSEMDSFGAGTGIEDGENHDHVEMDQLFGILANQRRRYVLKYLSLTEGVISLSDLSSKIAAWECDKRIEQLTSQERKRAYVGLYQVHLPKMAEVSAISYDERSGDIEAGEQFDHFSDYLRLAEQISTD